MQRKKITWQEPLKLAEKIAANYGDESWCFLYSGLSNEVKNSYSYIALFPQQKIVSDDFSDIQNSFTHLSSLAQSTEDLMSSSSKLTKSSSLSDLRMTDEKWFGYLSYELGQDFEKLPKTKKSFIDLPKIHLINFALVFEFDHAKKTLMAFFSDEKKLKQVMKWTPQQVRGDNSRADTSNSTTTHSLLDNKFRANTTNSITPHSLLDDESRVSTPSSVTPHSLLDDESRVSTPSSVTPHSLRGPLGSNFTDKSYLAAISDIKKLIVEGDFYQTNLTRKFFGEFTKKQNPQQAFELFAKLSKLSPANYSSFLKLDKNYIISASPELFFSIKNNKILSRPIKGTSARDADPKQDKKNKLFLKNSAKERAENLMIVDLVRNDLSRICKAGSVVVKKLFEINSYQNVHHMSSEIHGEILPNCTALQAISALFPAGSMTGSPKIKAMEVAAKKEKINRGIYSGAIGYLSGSETNLSVVIRTLILQENKFEFQTGGAITFDSDPKSELAEIFSKAKAIKNLLGVEL